MPRLKWVIRGLKKEIEVYDPESEAESKPWRILGLKVTKEVSLWSFLATVASAISLGWNFLLTARGADIEIFPPPVVYIDRLKLDDKGGPKSHLFRFAAQISAQNTSAHVAGTLDEITVAFDIHRRLSAKSKTAYYEWKEMADAAAAEPGAARYRNSVAVSKYSIAPNGIMSRAVIFGHEIRDCGRDLGNSGKCLATEHAVYWKEFLDELSRLDAEGRRDFELYFRFKTSDSEKLRVFRCRLQIAHKAFVEAIDHLGGYTTRCFYKR